MSDAPLAAAAAVPPPAPRILVVDDEEGPRRVLSQVVTRCAGTPDTAGSLAEARLLLARQRYACALVDGNLGADSGLELLRLLREQHPETDVIIVTGYPNLQSAVDALRMGAVDYFSKPFEVSALVQRLRLLLERRSLLDQRRHLPALVHTDRMTTLGRLSAGVAHELNNPLTAVSGNVELTMSLLTDVERVAPAAKAKLDDLRRFLADALKGTERIRQLVTDLRTYARAPTGPATVVDVHLALESALKLTHYELRHRGKLVKELRADRPVLAEPGRLMQVFVNLLVNAAQALEGPFEKNEVRVSSWCEDERVVVEVRDSGCGIPDEVRAHLFEPFFTTKPAGVGAGLGLSITHALVTGMGGSIAVESRPGEGSAFRVHLPATTAPAPVAEA